MWAHLLNPAQRHPSPSHLQACTDPGTEQFRASGNLCRVRRLAAFRSRQQNRAAQEVQLVTEWLKPSRVPSGAVPSTLLIHLLVCIGGFDTDLGAIMLVK